MTTVIAPSDLTWLIEPAAPTDGPALAELFDRCSTDTAALRFFGGVRAFPRSYLGNVLAGDPVRHDAVVARDRQGGGIVGLASLGAGSAAGADVPELGVLVADTWQRHGIGTAMVDLLVRRARDRGVERVLASVLPGRSAVLAALGTLPLERLWRTRDSLNAVYLLR